MVTAIIVAAGLGRRMGFDKLFSPLAGKPVIAHSVAAFGACPGIDEIVLVVREETREAVSEIVREEKKVTAIVPGGEERHLSVWAGLQAIDAATSSFIAIHDGARPLVAPDLISRCLDLARDAGAACCAAPIPDTVKRASDEDYVTESVERTGLWAMQTPQIFNSALILQAYTALISHGELVTDEVSAVQRLGKKVALLRNDDWNLKITFPRDLEMAEHILEVRQKQAQQPSRAG